MGRATIAALDLNREMMLSIRAEEELGFTFDNRKRRMYYVYTTDGTSVALEMVKAGLARPDGNYLETDQLRVAERDARNAKTGCLWRDPNAPPPVAQGGAEDAGDEDGGERV